MSIIVVTWLFPPVHTTFYCATLENWWTYVDFPAPNVAVAVFREQRVVGADISARIFHQQSASERKCINQYKGKLVNDIFIILGMGRTAGELHLRILEQLQ